MQSIKQIVENPEAGRDPKPNQETQKALTTVKTRPVSNASQISSYDCSVCKDTGIVMVDDKRHPGSKIADRSKCVFARILKHALPARYQKASLNDFRPAVAKAVNEWLKAPTDGLLLTGGTGTGKTHLAAAIFISQVKARKGIRFRRAAQLFQAIRD